MAATAAATAGAKEVVYGELTQQGSQPTNGCCINTIGVKSWFVCIEQKTCRQWWPARLIRMVYNDKIKTVARKLCPYVLRAYELNETMLWSQRRSTCHHGKPIFGDLM